MNWVRRIVSVVLILGFALGTTGRGAQPGMMAGMHPLAAAVMNHDGMPGCNGCINTGDTGKGMAMAGCQGGVCVVLPGLLPSSVGTISLAADAFVAITLTAPSGLSPPPDHPPPISASLA